MTSTATARGGQARLDLYWVPVGAGGHVVRVSCRAFEALAARHEHRQPRDLYHAALELELGSQRYVIEMAPVWGTPAPERGAVLEGPVGLRWLGRSRWFRYEVRRWRGGVIPDASYAVGGARTLSEDAGAVERLLELVPASPALVWGRDELRTGDMWNSNSLVSWLLARSELLPVGLGPPEGGRAPGWTAGLVLAARQAARLETGVCSRAQTMSSATS